MTSPLPHSPAWVNFSPWRQRLRAKHRRQYFFLLAVGVCAAIVPLLFWRQQLMAQLLIAQSQLNTAKESMQVLSQQQENNLRFQAILTEAELLRGQQHTSIHLLSLLSELISDNIQLSAMTLQRLSFSMSGTATSSSDITHLLAQLDRLELLEEAILVSLLKQPSSNHNRRTEHIFKFEIKAQVTQSHQPIAMVQ